MSLSNESTKWLYSRAEL